MADNVDLGERKSRLKRMLAVGAVMGIAGFIAGTSAIGRRARQRVPRDGHFIKVDGRRLHVRILGSGPPVVMIHGLGGQMRNFSYALTDRLEKKFKLILIDRPGSGYSDVAAQGFSLRSQAQIVAQAIRQLGIVRPLIVGHSFGGAVALAVALDNPGIAGGLALVSPLTQQPHSPAWIGLPIFRLRVGQRLLGRLAAPWLLLRRGTAIARKAFAPEAMPDDFAERGGGELTLDPLMLANIVADARDLATDMPAMAIRYASLRLPVDILFGQDDQILDPGLHGNLTATQIAEARLILMAGGHMLPVTQPDVVAEWVEQAQTRLLAYRS